MDLPFDERRRWSEVADGVAKAHDARGWPDDDLWTRGDGGRLGIESSGGGHGRCGRATGG